MVCPVSRLASWVTLAVRADARDAIPIHPLRYVLRVLCWTLLCDVRVSHLNFLAADVVWYALGDLSGDVLAAPASALCGWMM